MWHVRLDLVSEHACVVLYARQILCNYKDRLHSVDKSDSSFLTGTFQKSGIIYSSEHNTHMMQLNVLTTEWKYW